MKKFVLSLVASLALAKEEEAKVAKVRADLMKHAKFSFAGKDEPVPVLVVGYNAKSDKSDDEEVEKPKSAAASSKEEGDEAQVIVVAYTDKSDQEVEERELPDFAAPENKGKERKPIEHKERTGDELILKSVRKAKAAERDEQMAGDYKTQPWAMDKTIREPVYPEGVVREFKSPVFLVDPIFTEFKKDEEIAVFRGNDHAGWKQPKKPS